MEELHQKHNLEQFHGTTHFNTPSYKPNFCRLPSCVTITFICLKIRTNDYINNCNMNFCHILKINGKH